MGLIVRVDSNRAGGRGHRAEYRIPIDDLPVRTRPRKGAPIAGFMADQETGKRVQDVQGLSGERVQDVQGLEKERVQMATVKGADERTKKEGHLLKEPSIEPYKETTLSGSKEKRARAMSESWTLSPDDREWARVEHGLSDAEISEQADRFRDHFLANGKPLKNWSAAWHNWIRRAPEFSNGRGKSRTEERAGHPAAFDIEAYRDRSRGLR